MTRRRHRLGSVSFGWLSASPHKYIFYVLSIHTNFVCVSHAPQKFDG